MKYFVDEFRQKKSESRQILMNKKQKNNKNVEQDNLKSLALID